MKVFFFGFLTNTSANYMMPLQDFTRKRSYSLLTAAYKAIMWLLILPTIMYSVIGNKIKGTYNNNSPHSKL